MIRYECDKCGRRLGSNDSSRFIVKMEIYAAAGPMELSDLAETDTEAELRATVEQLRTTDPDEVEDDTYRCLRFDLCRTCQRELLRHPLGQ
jgi:transcription initiation factor IIE alpha subunit